MNFNVNTVDRIRKELILFQAIYKFDSTYCSFPPKNGVGAELHNATRATRTNGLCKRNIELIIETRNFRSKLWDEVKLLHKIVKSKTWTIIMIKCWVMIRKCRWDEKEGKKERKIGKQSSSASEGNGTYLVHSLYDSSERFFCSYYMITFAFIRIYEKCTNTKYVPLMTFLLIDDSIKINDLNLRRHSR